VNKYLKTNPLHIFLGYLRLTRPANWPTAIADVVAGGMIVGLHPLKGDADVTKLGWLALATVFLYASGMAFNDSFDAKIDQIERPERPIPSGLASRQGGFILAAMLMFMGIESSLQVTSSSFYIAIILSALILIYNGVAKQYEIPACITMGLCRSFNLLLGMSAKPDLMFKYGWVALIPLVYIFGITYFSRQEVGPVKPGKLKVGMAIYTLILAAMVGIAYWKNAEIPLIIGFVIVYIFLIMLPLHRSIKFFVSYEVRQAVKAGVLGIILIDTGLILFFTNSGDGFIIGTFLYLSALGLSKLFSVT